jgi:hypothetical protein
MKNLFFALSLSLLASCTAAQTTPEAPTDTAKARKGQGAIDDPNFLGRLFGKEEKKEEKKEEEKEKKAPLPSSQDAPSETGGE